MSYTTTIPKKNKIFEFSSPSRVPAAATPARARRRRRSARVSSLLTYFSLTSYLLRVSKDDDVPKVMVFSLLGVICIFFKKKKTRAFFCVVLSLSLSLSHSKGLFFFVVFFVINNTIRFCSMPPPRGGLETAPPRRSPLRPFFWFEKRRTRLYNRT